MKNIILFIGLCLFVNCNAQQILPLEKLGELRRIGEGAPEGTTSIRDVNNLLDKYVGTWKGTYADKSYEIVFVKHTKYSLLIKDQLLMRYKITSNGLVIEDNLNTPDNNSIIGRGDYLDKNAYIISYYGREFNCGQTGNIFIYLANKNDLTKIKLFLVPDHEFVDPNKCPNGVDKQVFPKDVMILTKQ
jgi:hypothetical protein